MGHSGDFEPIFLERTIEGKAYAIVDKWCEGYRRGVSLTAEQWSEGGSEVEKLLIPIMAFTEESDLQGHEYSAAEVATIQQEIAPNVQKLHAYWLARREDYTPPDATPMRAEPSRKSAATIPVLAGAAINTKSVACTDSFLTAGLEVACNG